MGKKVVSIKIDEDEEVIIESPKLPKVKLQVCFKNGVFLVDTIKVKNPINNKN